ncbi:MAG: ABC transporter ATP-binding protein [Armatimonadota bacterium]|nr:ABC transporter ATP-binding protein [Armatimonadota bacterium]
MTWAVRLEEVTKRYRGGGPRYATLRDHLAGIGRAALGMVARRPREPQGTLALDHVSFEVAPGEAFAIIGPNGAGKTTILKLISRITYPTEGRVRVRGRVGALIEVGSGLHPELTGRENIWLYGRIMGMTRREIGRRFDAIVEFAELTHALDTPVKMYSSGMQLRLGFSIASHLDPDIFVVDEALAVGDAGFQAKCVERMTKLVAEGRTILFVSHDLSAVETVCGKAVFLAGGRIHAAGPVREVLKAYLHWVDGLRLTGIGTGAARRPSRQIELIRVSCHAADGSERYTFSTGEDLEVRLRFRTVGTIIRPHVSIGITDGRYGNLALCSMLVDGNAPSRMEGETEVCCALYKIPLLPRVYQLWCSVRGEQAIGDVFDWQAIGAFRVVGTLRGEGPATVALTTVDGPVHIEHRWEVRPCP